MLAIFNFFRGRRNKHQYGRGGGGSGSRGGQGGRVRGSGIPRVKTTTTTTTSLPTQLPTPPPHTHAHQGISVGVWGGGSDTLRTYYTEDTPASVSHAASISDLSQLSIPGEEDGGRGGGKDDATRHNHSHSHSHSQLRPSLNDSGDNSSDNDNLLEQCIQSAMPKSRPGAKVKDVKLGVKRHGSGHLCSHSTPPPTATVPPLASPRHTPHHHSRPVPVARVTPAVKVGGARVSPHPPTLEEVPAGDQVRTWVTEGTPAAFSRADSLSSLSCDDDGNRASRESSPRPQGSPRSQVPKPQIQTQRTRSPHMRPHQHQQQTRDVDEESDVPKQFAVEGTPGVFSRHSSLSSIEGEDEHTAIHQVSGTQQQQPGGIRNFIVEDTPVCFSRNSSLSSLSVESFGEETTPTEQALLQQCISQGMPKSKSDLETQRRQRRRGGSRIPAPSSRSPGPGSRSPAPGSRSPARLIPGVPMQRLTLCREDPPGQAKNVAAAAAAVALSDANPAAATTTPDAESCKLRTDSEQSEKSERAYRQIEEDREEEEEEEESATDVTEADSEQTTATTAEIAPSKSDMTSEDSGATVVDNLKKDEEEHSPELEERISVGSGEAVGSSPEEKHSWTTQQRNSTEKSSPSEGRGSDTSVTASMSESAMLAVEAIKVARAVAGEAKQLSSDEMSHMSQSITSAASDACLDNIKPPSAMGSLASMSNSLTNSAEDHRGARTNNNNNNHRRLECRHTRRVPEMVRRALGEQDYGSTENMASMASSCHSNVDNIPPPSMLDDDMENSMISVASITSEVAEQRESPPSPPADHTLQVAAPARQLAAVFQQEALNAASTLTLTGGDEASTYQEITDITEHEETVGPASDTELAADDLPADIPDLPQDGFNSPLCGSNHSSPHRQGTPRTRRALTKDRFRTFTRDGEVSSDATPSQDTTDSTLVEALPPASQLLGRTPKQRRHEEAERFRTRTISSDSHTTTSAESSPSKDPVKDKVSPKRSPKNRRLQDPTRFQTHTISEPQIKPEAEELEEASDLKIEDLDEQTGSQLKSQQQGRQSFRQRRQEDRERYQTRTIDVPLADITPEAVIDDDDDDDDDGGDKEPNGSLVDFQDSNEMLDLTAEQLEALQQDANIVICTLNETREAMTSESSDLLSEENILDIETLSLISNEDESEMRNFLQDFDDDPPDKGDEGDEEEEEEAEKPVQRRPRIVKPGQEAPRPPQPEEEDECASKGIRGRRKPLYSSARKYGVTTRPVTSGHSITTRTAAVKPTSVRPSSASPVKPSSPKLPRATRASALRQNSNLHKGGSSGEDSPTGRATGSSAGSSAGSSPRLGPGSRNVNTVTATTTITRPTRSKSLARPGPDVPKPLQRQNTFTKDDSDTPPSPERNTLQTEAKKNSGVTNRGLVKPRLRRDIVQPSPGAVQPTCSSGGHSGIPKSGSQDLSPTKGRPSQHKSASLTRDARPPTSSDVAEWRHDTKKTTVKKEVTSRIANLWKRVERAQTKPKEEKKDGRQWISRNKSSSAKESSPSQPLVRSSTYEKLSAAGGNSGGSEAGKTKTRLGLKLAKLRGRDTRSSPPSEATTPVDSRPHCLVSPTRTRLVDVGGGRSETVTLRQRPATHPPGTHVSQMEEDGETRAKRLSRLGSFIVVGEDGKVQSPPPPPQSAIVPPFNYQPPTAPRVRSAVATRIPQPSSKSSSVLSNAPCGRDDNGNAPQHSTLTWQK
ncbi:hypothetical protein Pcinc_024854 [Petrolisthes cinctipes]|uniref:Uncharacterized protein n=1 Tax=Petrolisthes cinctipes TaxID=88211 RepID=A0AAE1F961_PETCI|nr:hypothetical protein Pcinc_024854 [Petrolisthes cinctipes]